MSGMEEYLRVSACVCKYFILFQNTLPVMLSPFALSAVSSFVSKQGCDPV